MNSREQEIIEELRDIAPKLAELKDKMISSNQHRDTSYWENYVDQLNVETSPLITVKKINRRWWAAAAIIAPLIVGGIWLIQVSEEPQKLAEISELEEDLLIELLATQSHQLGTEELIDINISSENITSIELLDNE